MLSPSAILLDHAGIIQYATDTLLTQAGFSIAEVVDRRPKEVWGGYMEPSIYAQTWEQARAGEPTRMIVTNKSKEGDWYTNQLHIVQISSRRKDTKPYYLGYVPQEYITGATDRFFSVWRADRKDAARHWLHEVLGLPLADDSHAMIHAEWILPLKEQFAARYTDAALITRAQEHSEQFGELYHKYYKNVYQFLSAKVGYQHDLAEELTQETFLQAFRYLDTYTAGYASYQTYLYRVAHSRLVSYLRKQRDTSPLIHIDDVRVSIAPNTEQIDVDFLLARARTVLSPAEYETIVAYYVREESIREISTAMGKSVNAIKLLLSRARKKVSQILPQA